jgi:predicted alpha/beta hydrolase family esterase
MSTPPKLTDEQIFELAGNYDCGMRHADEEWRFSNPRQMLTFVSSVESAVNAQWLERLKAVEAQRDELLVALEDLVLGTPINEFNRSDDGLGCHFGNYEKREKAARAAIAKAQASEPTPREWVGLTDEQAWVMWEAAVFVANKTGTLAQFTFARNIAAKLKELNHG